MIRIVPNRKLLRKPCLVTALSCACDPHGRPEVKADGYASLTAANKWIRENVKVKRRTNYRRGERPKLKDLHLEGKAIVCVYGHYVFVDGEAYWSFFGNENDEVVTVWEVDV